MPNRILRDWTDSKPMNLLLWQEEVLFARLIMKADDYGNFYRDTSLVKSLLFPRKDDLRGNDIDRWLNKLEAAGLILTYPAKGEIFLHIRNFGQRLDKRTRKFPEEPPNADENIFPESPGKSITETNKNPNLETELETETQTKTGASVCENSTVEIYPTFDDFWNLYNKKVGREKSEKLWGKIPQGERLKIMEHIPDYIRAQPESQYRKNPETFLYNKSWNDEIIERENNRHPNGINGSNHKSVAGNKRASLDELENLATRIIQHASGSNSG